MLRFERTGSRSRLRTSSAVLPVVTLSALILGGCSADVARFDSTSFAFNDETTTGSLPDRQPRDTALFDQRPATSPGSSQTFAVAPDTVERRALPATEERYADASVARGAQPIYDAAPVQAEARYEAPRYAAAPMASPSSGTITVEAGDTLYGLSRRHGVSVEQLMSANGLGTTTIRPGQTLVLPGAGVSDLRPVARATPPRDAAPTYAAPVSEPVAISGDSYTVQPGDSLYKISRQAGVSVADLKAINGITDVRRIRPGTVLRLKGAASTQTYAEAPRSSVTLAELPQSQVSAPSVPLITPTEDRVATRQVATIAQPRIINGAGASAPPTTTQPVRTMTDAAPATPQAGTRVASVATQAAGASRELFRWPVTGKVISGFGPRQDGSHNDGIDISVPMGTDVHAAEGGVIAYAGNELKGYGNLILIRHDNGWVSAYAHSETMLVRRGDRVSRGQVIAKAGKTGSVDQPQLHFELRDGAKPVDPMPYLERL